VYAKPLIQVGIALIFLAIVAFTYKGAGGAGNREQGVQLWPVRAGIDAMKALAQSPVATGLVFVSGIGLVALGARKTS
jgi:hypothetical protein